MKLDINTIITQAYHISRCSSWKLSSKARIAWAFIILLRIQQGKKQKRYHSKSDFRRWQAAHEYQKTLDSSCTSFCKNDSKKHHELTQNSVSFSCESKQVPRCCINFPHELTCQILTNQSIGLGARPTRDYGEKSEKHLSSPPVFLHNWLNFRVRG